MTCTKKKKKRRRCQVCGLLKDDVVTDIDPYIQDVHGKEVKVAMCSDCYSESVADI